MKNKSGLASHIVGNRHSTKLRVQKDDINDKLNFGTLYALNERLNL